MFIKKFHCLISLLYLNLIRTTFAVDINLADCTVASGTFSDLSSCSNPTSYCYSTSTNKIHPVEGTSPSFTCKNTELAEGVHYFIYTSASEVVEIANDEAITDADTTNLIMYICDASKKCIQTIGFAKLKIHGNEAGTGDAPESWADNYAKYCKIDSGKCKILSETEDWAEDTFYEVEDTEYTILKTGSTAVEDGEACTTGSIGLIDDNKKLCFGEEAANVVDYTVQGNYILFGDLSDDSIFKSLVSKEDGSEGIIITVKASEIYYNNLENTSKLVFTNDDFKKLEIGGDISSSNTKLLLFDCVDGTCTRISGYISSGSVFYTALSGGASSAFNKGDSVTLESTYCNGKIGTIITDGTDNYLCLDESLSVDVTNSGYYVIEGTGDSGSPFEAKTNVLVKVESNFITIEGDLTEKVENDGKLVINIGDDDYRVYTYGNPGNTFTFDDTYSDIIISQTVDGFSNIYSVIDDSKSIDPDDASSIILLSCSTGVCKKTSGFVLLDNDTIKKCTNGVCTGDATSDSTNNCSSSVGKVIKDNTDLKICVTESTKDNNGVYLLPNEKYSLYSFSSGIVVTNVPENGYYIVSNNKLVTNTETAGESLVLCSNGDGTCTESAVSDVNIGYYKNAADPTKYIKCEGALITCKNIEIPGEECDDSIGILKNGGICLATGNSSGKQANFADGKKYIVPKDNDSIFKDIVTEEDTFGLIEANDNSITLISINDDTTYCVKDDSLIVESYTDEATCTSASGTAYTCNNLGICKAGETAPGKSLSDCEGTLDSTCPSPKSYCLSSTTNSIYPVDGPSGGFTCKNSALGEGIHYFKFSSSNSIVEIAADEAISTKNAKNIIMYLCDNNSKCSQTIGYAKLKIREDDVISESTAPDSWAANFVKYCKIVNGKCKILSNTETWAADTFYNVADKEYAIIESGAAIVEAGSACTTGSIGSIDDNKKLCLDETANVVADYNSNNYILAGDLAETSIFKSFVTETDGSKGILLTSTSKEIYYNSIETIKIKIFNTDTKKEQSISGDISDQATKLALYECGRKCTRTNGYVRDGKSGTPNYYSISSSSSKVADAGDKAEDCDDVANSGKLVTESLNLCVGTKESISFPSTAGNYIISDGSTGYKFVKTLDGIISISGITGTIEADGLYIVNISTATVVDNPDANDVDNILNYINLYLCDHSEFVCRQTYGYIKSSDDSFYKIASNGNVKLEGESQLVETCTSFGQAKTDDNTLCIGAGTSLSFESANYVVELSGANAFTSRTSGSILLKGTANSITLNTIDVNASGKYIIKLGTKYNLFNYDISQNTISLDTLTANIDAYDEIIDDSIFLSANILSTSVHLFKCSNGICLEKDGFIKVGSSISKCETGDCSGDATSDTASAVGCTEVSDPYKLVIDGDGLKFCEEQNSDAINIDTNSYYYNNNIYTGNDGTASTIVVVEPNVAGAYIVGTDNKLKTTVGVQTTGKLNICTAPGSCVSKTIPSEINGSFTGYYFNANDPQKLILCTSNTSCELITPSIGYYKNGNNEYVSCAASDVITCESYTKDDHSCHTDSATFGQIDTNGKLCLGYNDEDAAEFKVKAGTLEANKYYIVSYHEGSPFVSKVDESSEFGIVKVDGTGNAITFDSTGRTEICVTRTTFEIANISNKICSAATEDKYQCNNGVCVLYVVKQPECNVDNGSNCSLKTYYLVDSNTKALIDGPSGILYYCDVEGTACTQITNVGYYINDKTNAYKCEIDGVLTCGKFAIPTAADCSSNVSEIIINSSNSDQLTMCIKSDKPVPLTNGNSGIYAVTEDASSIFGNTSSDEFAIIELKEKSIILKSDYKSGIKYVYANINSNYKILEKSNNSSCPLTNDSNKSVIKNSMVELINCTDGVCQKNTNDEVDL